MSENLSPTFNDETAFDRPDMMTDAEYRVAFQKMADDYFTGRAAREFPVLFYVTGLPGSGKSTFVARQVLTAPDIEDAVHINFDALRVYHPRYEDHVKADPVNAAARIDLSVEKMIGWLVEQSARRKYNVLLDDAAMGQNVTRAIMAPFVAADYDITAIVIATPAIVARQAVHLRFEEDFQAATQGKPVLPRWVNNTEQDEAPAALVETVETLVEDGIADELLVIDRHDKALYVQTVHAKYASAAGALKQEMHRELDAPERDDYIRKAERIATLMSQRAAQHPPAQGKKPKQASVQPPNCT